MKTLKDDHYMYLKCDVYLLADVFEKFRNNNLKNYGQYSKTLFERTSLKLGCNA